MIVTCEHCVLEYPYDAEYYLYEPSVCPDCGHINFVLNFDDIDCPVEDTL